MAYLLYPAQCFLGEGPLWHPARKSCFWTDIEARKFYEYSWSDHTVSTREVDYKVTLILRDKHEQLLLGLNGGLARYNLDEDKLEWLLDIEKEMPDHRCNDGACDSKGRLWVGSMHSEFITGAGSLYCVDDGLTLQKKLERVSISNGIAWSPDNLHMYYIDTPRRTVSSFRFDQASGQIEFESVAVHIPANLGVPDGMAIDEEGMLWIAHWGGFGVYKWNPRNGELLDMINLPVPNVTSCAFSGEYLDHLVITTARQDLNGEELRKYPESGDVFIARPGVKGLPENKCRF